MPMLSDLDRQSVINRLEERGVNWDCIACDGALQVSPALGYLPLDQAHREVVMIADAAVAAYRVNECAGVIHLRCVNCGYSRMHNIMDLDLTDIWQAYNGPIVSAE